MIFTLCMQVDGVAWGHKGQQQSKTKVVSKKATKSTECPEGTEGKGSTLTASQRGPKVIKQKGEASYYGKGFHGKKTASGDTFNQYEETAAHPTLPLGTEAEVTNLETGKSVEVEITDRGPYAKGRDIDLSKKAAKKIGLSKDGVVPVKIEAKVPAKAGVKQTNSKCR